MTVGQITAEQLNPAEIGEHVVERRFERIENRIQAGVSKGDLSEEESTRFLETLASIKETYAQFKEAGGGNLAPEDRRQINQSLNELSRQIFWARRLTPEIEPGD